MCEPREKMKRMAGSTAEGSGREEETERADVSRSGVRRLEMARMPPEVAREMLMAAVWAKRVEWEGSDAIIGLFLPLEGGRAQE